MSINNVNHESARRRKNHRKNSWAENEINLGFGKVAFLGEMVKL